MVEHYEVLQGFLNQGNLTAAAQTMQHTTTLPDKDIAEVAKADKQSACTTLKQMLHDKIAMLKQEHDIK